MVRWDVLGPVPCSVTSNDLRHHHTSHVRASPHSHSHVNSHGTYCDSGYHAAHGTPAQHSHAIHSAVHSAHHGGMANANHTRTHHRVPPR